MSKDCFLITGNMLDNIDRAFCQTAAKLQFEGTMYSALIFHSREIIKLHPRNDKSATRAQCDIVELLNFNKSGEYTGTFSSFDDRLVTQAALKNGNSNHDRRCGTIHNVSLESIYRQ